MPSAYRADPQTELALNSFIKLMRARNSVTARLAPGLTQMGLTESQFGLMEALLHLGPMCQRDVGRKLLKSGGNITIIAKNLEKRGLIVRVPGAEDRRFLSLELTACGRVLIEKAFEEHAERIRIVMSVLSPEEHAILGPLLKKLGLGRPAEDLDGP